MKTIKKMTFITVDSLNDFVSEWIDNDDVINIIMNSDNEYILFFWG